MYITHKIFTISKTGVNIPIKYLDETNLRKFRG